MRKLFKIKHKPESEWLYVAAISLKELVEEYPTSHAIEFVSDKVIVISKPN